MLHSHRDESDLHHTESAVLWMICASLCTILLSAALCHAHMIENLRRRTAEYTFFTADVHDRLQRDTRMLRLALAEAEHHWALAGAALAIT